MENLAGWDPRGAAPLPDIPEKDTLLPDLSGENISQAGTPGRDTVTIVDAGVPLTSVPKTGNESAVRFCLTFLSAAGLLCLVAAETKKNKKN